MSIEIKKSPSFWTDQSGMPLSDEVLKVQSKSWTSEMWEEYLSSLECGLCESQIPEDEFDSLNDRTVESIFVNAQTSSSAVDFAQVHNAMSVLTPRQREVLELIFFKSLKQREVARILKISEQRVRDLKKIALKKVRQFFQGGGSHLPISRSDRNEVVDD